MNKPPPQIATPASAKEISDHVRRLLRASDVSGQLPTPKAQVVACARLVELGEIDLAEYQATILDKAAGIFHQAMSKVLGFLDRRSESIYIDAQLRDSRKLFVTFHEVTHKILLWQHSIAYTEEDESTLSVECNDMFESEANFGAAEILFQCERFEQEARDYEVSVDSAIYLADRYGASYHSTLRRFIERNHRACLLLVLKATSRQHPEGRSSFYVVYSIPSAPFTLEFGDPLQLQFVNPEHELGKILNNGAEGEIALRDLYGVLRPCAVEVFSNWYRTFVLIRPKDIRPARRIVHFRN